jgi:hypothetical protein
MVAPQTMTYLSTAVGADQAKSYSKMYLELSGYFKLHLSGGHPSRVFGVVECFIGY